MRDTKTNSELFPATEQSVDLVPGRKLAAKVAAL